MILVICILIGLLGCTSSLYVIEEVEEVVTDEVKSPSDSNLAVNTDNTEIKEDLKSEKLKENKFSDKEVVAKEYAVQIGAFSNESNAISFMRKAKNRLQDEIYYKDVQGLYKVRIGNFNSKTEALSMLEKMISTGFSDSFVVELTFVKVPE
jgi:cell division protein FtsN